MCEFQGKLVAWLDRELRTEEASEVERHIKCCKECGKRMATYAQVSETFDRFYDAVMAAKAPRRVGPWAPVLAGAVIVAVAVAVIFGLFPRTRMERPPVLEATPATVSVRAPEPAVAEVVPRKATIRRRPAARALAEYVPPAQPMDTAIQIAIPAEAMFPPGAIPSGVNFMADLRIAPDGSVKQVRLRQ
jgi:hypothetical protein